ncbi:MAG: ABC transporter permease [Planctomycetes bacterium]|nr:ABC transporter permease [Planctomycetota bacterium]
MNGGTPLAGGLRRLGALYRRELLSFFVSPIAYIVLFVFLLMNGVAFYFFLRAGRGSVELLISWQYSSVIFWFLTLLVPPLLTMRAFAEEHRSATFELLATTGAADATLVAGKFLAAWTFFLLLWLALLVPYAMLEWSCDLDWGIVLAVHGGLALAGALFTAIGICASSFTRNQLVAASTAMIANLLIFFLNYFRLLYEAGDCELRVFDYLSPLSHFMNDFAIGIFDARYVVLYGSLTCFFLFLAAKALERRRWW